MVKVRKWLLLLPIAVGLADLTVGAGVVRTRSAVRERSIQVRNRVERECSAYRRGNPRHARARVCNADRFGPSDSDRMLRVKRLVASAEDALADGVPQRAKTTLREAAAITDEIDRGGTFVSAAIASSATRLVLDALDRAGPALGPEDRRDILTKLDLESARAPLEGERVDRAWQIANSADGPSGLGFVTDAIRVDRMVEIDATLAEMQRRAIEQDLAGCERAATGYPTAFVEDEAPRSWCGRAIEIVRMGDRLERARAHAAPGFGVFLSARSSIASES